MDDLVAEFLAEACESLDVVDNELVRFERDPANARILDNIFRLVHTIKGTCGFLALPRLEALTHAAETVMGRMRDGEPVTPDAVSAILEAIDRLKAILAGLEAEGGEPQGSDADLISRLARAAEGAGHRQAPAPVAARSPAQDLLDDLERAFRDVPGPGAAPAPETARSVDDRPATPAGAAARSQSIRVSVDTLEHLIDTVSELVLTRNQLLEIVRRHEDSEFKVPLQRLSNVTADLQESVMKTRMQPIGSAWQKLPRMVRDLARELGKSIDLDMAGADTELDRQVLELIRDPLTHMVRNAADHGLEDAASRRAAGKRETGTIRLGAYHQGGHIVVEVGDDGRGLDTARIRQKAVACGLAGEAELETMTETQIQRLIFSAGFSTAAEVTSVSGRGVGMDVVRANIELIGGSVHVRSGAGEGTVFTIRVPLTLAIVSALIIETAGQRFAIPQVAVLELLHAPGAQTRVEHMRDTPVVRFRDRLLPLVDLAAVLKLREPASAHSGVPGGVAAGFIVVLQVGTHAFGVVVDAVLHTEEIVVKPMSALLRSIPAFSGNTILGDGTVIMVVDPGGLSQMVAADPAADTARTGAGGCRAAPPRRETTSLLLFRAGSDRTRAVPVSLVTRLEELEAARIEPVDGRHLVQYRGGIMPVVYMNDAVKRRGEGIQPVIVFGEDGRSMGLAVDEIVDIVDEPPDLEIASAQPGVLGTATLCGRATEIVDVGHYLPLAFEDRFARTGGGCAAVRRLLLVDDSAFFRNLLTPVLRSAGYEVMACADAGEALAVLGSHAAIDILVSDVEMPGMSGYRLAETVRADVRTASLPIVAVSSMSRPEDLARGREAGFTAHVAKSDRAGLLEALAGLGASTEEAA